MPFSATQSVTRALGYAGLIPFVLPAAIALSGSPYADLAASLAGAYALAIICFLCGSWWGMAQTSGARATLLLSNVYLLLALAAYLIAADWWALAAALLLAGAWICEQSSRLFPAYPRQYRRMRAILMLLAGASMAIIHVAATARQAVRPQAPRAGDPNPTRLRRQL
jgi:hypothetical protein